MLSCIEVRIISSDSTEAGTVSIVSSSSLVQVTGETWSSKCNGF